MVFLWTALKTGRRLAVARSTYVGAANARRSGADLGEDGVNGVQGVLGGEDFFQLVFELGFGFELVGIVDVSDV